MKRPVQFLLITLFYLAALISCTSGNDNVAKVDSQQPPPQFARNKNVIHFKANGEEVTSSGWNINRSVLDGMLVLNVTSNMHRETRTINININGDKPGTYNFSDVGGYNKTGAAYGSYYPDYKEDMMNSFSFEEGAFVITSIDTAAGILNAEFSGTAKNIKGETIIITNGYVEQGQLDWSSLRTKQ